MKRSRSLRAQFLGIVLAGAVLPLAALGFWLSRSAVRSGEALLESQLESTLTRQTEEISRRWTHRRSDVMLLADNVPIRAALPDTLVADAPPFLTQAFGTMTALQSAIIRDAAGRARWVLGDRPTDDGARFTAEGVVARSPTIPLAMDVPGPSGTPIGVVQAFVRVSEVVPAPLSAGVAGELTLAVRDRDSGSWLVAPAIPRDVLSSARFSWDGSRWLSVRRALHDPPIDLMLASRLDPVLSPFARNARVGAAALAIAALVVVLVTVLATLRLTRSLEQLAVAADSVAHGDFERRLETGGPDEVARVTRAFNTMTESLRRMLRERSQREALAAMGELAAVLAHQVRSPLTAMRLDLQRVETRLGRAESERELVTRAIRQLDRLERAVSGALRMAKTASGSFEPLNIFTPLDRAVAGVEHEFRARGAVLEYGKGNDTRLDIHGDAGTLEQLFSNVLLNAAEAMRDKDRASVTASRENGQVSVVIEDTGIGMDAGTLARIFEPYYSTKPDGTGIGLAVAQRIVSAHDGKIVISSEAGRGTRVVVTFSAA